jgi:predicted TPR repeat methyltransferase
MSDHANHAASLPDLQTSHDLIADRRYSYAMALLQDKDADAAKDLFQQVLERVPDWPPALLGMGEAFMLSGETQHAGHYFQRCLETDASDRLGAAPRLARMKIIEADQAIRPGYVAALFDDYAKRFDTHLVNALEYSAPQQLLEALITIRHHYERCYDLGCGTGLMGKVLRPYVSYLAGCDLSNAMLYEARSKAIYDRLECKDCTHALTLQQAEQFDLITAADVLVYIGSLTTLLKAVHLALKPDGIFAFTTQATEGDAFIIGDDLRAAHSEAYLRQQAQSAHLEMLACQSVSVRKDRDHPVKGWLCLLRKP